MDSILDGAAAQLDDPALSLRLAREIPVGALGVADYMFCASPTFRDAATRLARYYRLVSDRGHVVLSEGETHSSLVFGGRPSGATDRYWVELVMACVALRIRHTIGRAAKLHEVRFSHAALGTDEAHAQFFGAPVRFSSSEDSLVFPTALLEAPFRTAAPALATLVDENLSTLEPAVAEADQLVARVRHVIGELLDTHEQGVDRVAARLQVSARTLQRELQRRGTSHSAIIDEVRRARGIELLDNGLTVAEVAERLGFSESGAFFRAFRRWTNTSPRAFQRGRQLSKPE